MTRYWTCQRRHEGLACRKVNEARKRNCGRCGKPKPARKQPAHMKALGLSYEQYVELNGGEERCGICKAVRKPDGKRLHRDHDHRSGAPRGILCFRCNSALRSYMTSAWLRSAAAYLERTLP